MTRMRTPLSALSVKSVVKSPADSSRPPAFRGPMVVRKPCVSLGKSWIAQNGNSSVAARLGASLCARRESEKERERFRAVEAARGRDPHCQPGSRRARSDAPYLHACED